MYAHTNIETLTTTDLSDFAKLFSDKVYLDEKNNAKFVFEALKCAMEALCRNISLNVNEKEENQFTVLYEQFQLKIKVEDNLIFYLVYPSFVKDFKDYYAFCKNENINGYIQKSISFLSGSRVKGKFPEILTNIVYSRDYKKDDLKNLKFSVENCDGNNPIIVDPCIELLKELKQSSFSKHSTNYLEYFDYLALKKKYTDSF